VPVACFGAIALGQQEDMWLRPNLPLRANFTYPRNIKRNGGLDGVKNLFGKLPSRDSALRLAEEVKNEAHKG